MPMNNGHREYSVKLKKETCEGLSRDSMPNPLDAVKSTALSLTNAVGLVPSACWLEVVDILQQTLDNAANVVTRGMVSHVDMVPGLQEKNKNHSKTLREVVICILGRQTITMPCSVVVQRLTEWPNMFETAEVASSQKEMSWRIGSGTQEGLSMKEEDDFTLQTDDDAEDGDDEGNSHTHDGNYSDTKEMNESVIEERKPSIDYSESDTDWEVSNSRHSKSRPTKKPESKSSSKNTLNTHSHNDDYPYGSQPLVGHLTSNYDIGKITIKSYNSYDLDASFSTGINSTCPLCSKDSAYKSSNLRDLLTHLKNANHLTIEGKTSYNLSCPYCEKHERAAFKDNTKEESLLLELLGELVHHLVEQHSYSPSSDFLLTFKCKCCNDIFFSKARFENHMQQHICDSAKPGSYSTGKNQSVQPSKQKNHPKNLPTSKQTQKVSRNIIEKYEHYSLRKVFEPSTKSNCTFCPLGSEYKATSLADFVEHMVKSQHFEIKRHCVLKCPHCKEPHRNKINPDEGSMNRQMLRLVGKVIQHMVRAHAFVPDPTFLPPYSCDLCNEEFYADQEFLHHLTTAHQNGQEKIASKTPAKEPAKPPLPAKRSKTKGWCINSKSYSKAVRAPPPNKKEIANESPEAELDFDDEIPGGGIYCIFCDSKNNASLKTLDDFITHMETASHVVETEESGLAVICPKCPQRFKVSELNEQNDHRALVLPAIKDTIQHLHTNHGYDLDQSFLHKFKFKHCNFGAINSSRPIYSRKIQCPTCTAMLTTGYMKEHVKHCSKPKDQFKRSPCPICGKMLLNDDVPNHKANFRKHVKSCQTVKPVFSHLCSVCSTQFKLRNDLNRHMFQKHNINISRITPKYCDKCGYRALSKLRFLRHLATHNTTKNFTCEKCGKQVKNAEVLRIHLTTVHKTKESKATLFHCNQCSYTTPVRAYLSKHLRHHRDKNTGSGYWCNICKYNARYPAMLKKHMQKVHNIDIGNPSPNEVHSFTSSRGMIKHKNIRLPEEESTGGNKVHDGPLKQWDVQTKEKLQVSSTKTMSGLEQHRQESEGRLESVHTEEGNSEIETNRDPARLNNTEPRLDHSVVGLPAIGLGQVFDAGLGGMMNNGGHFGDLNRPTQTPAGDVDLSYSLPPANSLAYNLPNMFFQ